MATSKSPAGDVSVATRIRARTERQHRQHTQKVSSVPPCAEIYDCGAARRTFLHGRSHFLARAPGQNDLARGPAPSKRSLAAQRIAKPWERCRGGPPRPGHGSDGSRFRLVSPQMVQGMVIRVLLVQLWNLVVRSKAYVCYSRSRNLIHARRLEIETIEPGRDGQNDRS